MAPRRRSSASGHVRDDQRGVLIGWEFVDTAQQHDRRVGRAAGRDQHREVGVDRDDYQVVGFSVLDDLGSVADARPTSMTSTT
jgi:hypothetical protein